MRAPEVTIAAVVVEVRCCVEVCFPKISPPPASNRNISQTETEPSFVTKNNSLTSPKPSTGVLGVHRPKGKQTST